MRYQPTSDDPWLQCKMWTEAELNKMLRERKILLLKKYHTSADMEKRVLPAREENETVRCARKIYSDMRKSMNINIQSDYKGGERKGGAILNLTGERVATRQCENTFSSPTSKKMLTKNKSVAELSMLFGPSGGGRGQESSLKGVTWAEGQDNIHNNSLCYKKPKQNYFQKLQQFRAPHSDIPPDDEHIKPHRK